MCVLYFVLFWIEETILNLGLSWGEQREDFARNASPADSIFFFHSNGSILGHWHSANHFCGTCRFSQDALRCVFSWNLLIGLFFNVLDLDLIINIFRLFFRIFVIFCDCFSSCFRLFLVWVFREGWAKKKNPRSPSCLRSSKNSHFPNRVEQIRL